MKTKIKNMAQNLAKRNKLFRDLYRKLQHWNRKRVYRNVYRNNAIDDKLVLFESFQGRSVSCSPKALYMAMISDPVYKDYHFVWAVNNVEKHAYLKKNRDTKVIKRISGAYNKNLASAKYLVFNSAVPQYVKLKQEQVYVQTWHGTPLKRLGCDIEASGSAAFNLKDIRRQYKENGSKFTYLLSPSAYTTEKLSSAFALSPERQKEIIIEEGYPRNAALFCYTPEELAGFRRRLKLPEQKKVVLYAPTYRDNQFEFAVGFQYKGEMDFDRLMEDLGEDCVVLFRAHCQIADKFDFGKYAGFVYDVSKYEDVNELYAVSDILVTDYSSVFFDYANLRRPIVFYMYDLDEYQNNVRDFYLDLKELPGPVTTTQEEMTAEIKKSLSGFVFDEGYERFNKKFNYLDDGEAGKRVLKHILGADGSQ